MEHGIIEITVDGKKLTAKVDEEGFHTGDPNLDDRLDGEFFGHGVHGDPVVRAINYAAEKYNGTVLQCPEPEEEYVGR